MNAAKWPQWQRATHGYHLPILRGPSIFRNTARHSSTIYTRSRDESFELAQHGSAVSNRRSRRIMNAPLDGRITSKADPSTLMQYVANVQAIDKQTQNAVLQVFQDDLRQEGTKEYLRQLVDFYDDAVVQSNVASANDNRTMNFQQSEDEDDFPDYHTTAKEADLSESAQEIVRELRYLILKGTTHWRTLWDKYQELSEPRIQQLPDGVLRNMLRHLGTQDPDDDEIKTGELSAAYTALIEEMAHARIRIWRKDWNTAMHLYLKSKAVVNEEAVAEVMRMWQNMENKFNCKADVVTFTVLYLAAAKAQMFGVADNLWRQMRSHGHLVDRHARIAAIHVGGLRGSRNEITNAYASLVEDGHAVDISVLNVVTKAFVDAGAISAAEEVLRRVRCISEQASIAKLTVALRDWRERRALNKLLKKSPTLSSEAQWHLQAILHSNMVLSEQSYIPLIRWYAYTSPNFDRLRSILQEMSEAGLAVSPATFLIIFQAFKMHASSNITELSSATLSLVTMIFKKQLEADQRFQQMASKLPIAAIEACHVHGMVKEARQVWKAILKQWKPSAWVKAKVTSLIGRDALSKKLSAQNDEQLGIILSEAVG